MTSLNDTSGVSRRGDRNSFPPQALHGPAPRDKTSSGAAEHLLPERRLLWVLLLFACSTVAAVVLFFAAYAVLLVAAVPWCAQASPACKAALVAMWSLLGVVPAVAAYVLARGPKVLRYCYAALVAAPFSVVGLWALPNLDWSWGVYCT